MSMEQCTEPGCTGFIEDGYCNVCGTPAHANHASGSTGTTGTGSAKHPALSTKLSSTPIGSARAGLSRPTRRLVTATSRIQHLGAGITTVPSAPVPDPQSVVIADPQVPEDKRFCSVCGEKVGRARGDRPGRAEGFCPKCGTPYS